jgi:hypothetical protein
MDTIKSSEGAEPEVFKTLNVRKEGAVLFAEIAAPPMNLLGPELVRLRLRLAAGESIALY